MDPNELLRFGGFAALGLIMVEVVRRGFEAWRKGDLISRQVWERTEGRADALAVQLERNTDALVDHTATMRRVADTQDRLLAAAESQARALERLADRK